MFNYNQRFDLNNTFLEVKWFQTELRCEAVGHIVFWMALFEFKHHIQSKLHTKEIQNRYGEG